MPFYTMWGSESDQSGETSLAVMESPERRGSVNIANPRDPILAEWFSGGAVSAGVTVNEKAVKGIPAALRCVAVLSQTVAGLPIRLMRKTPDGTITEAINHPLSRLFRDGPGLDMDGYQFRELAGVHLTLRGNFYAFIEVSASGMVQLFPINPDWVRVHKSASMGRIYEVFNPDGKSTMYSPDEIFHLQGIGSDGIHGLNPIQMHRQSLGLTLAQDEFGAAFYGNGTHLGNVFTKKEGYLSDEAFNRLKKELTEKRAGLKNSHQALILEEGLEPTQMSMSARDAQFIEARKFQVPEVCRIFGVPPHKVYDLERATFSNIEEQSIDFLQDSILPYTIRWEMRLNKTLLTERERREGYYWKHNVTGLLRANSQMRAQFYRDGINAGWLTRNEARAFEDLSPIEGLDKPLAPLNMGDGTREPAEGEQEGEQ